MDEAAFGMQEPRCPRCRAVFDSWAKLRHHHMTEHGESLPNKEWENCGEWFYSEYAKYCSDDCRSVAYEQEGEANNNYRGAKESTQCEICGTDFEYYPSEKEGLYCPECVESENWRHNPDISGADNPRWSGGKLELECAVCGDTVERYPSNVTGEVTLCDRNCFTDWLSDAFTGEGHPNWEGGGTDNYGKGWNRVRRQALERDDHECVVCGTTSEELGRNPDVHHIVPVRLFDQTDGRTREDAHDLNNVVSLCPGCHRSAEFGNIPRQRLWDAIDIPADDRLFEQ